jgi:uncharacterized protein
LTYLLDVNVLIALIDPAHVHHTPAHGWFETEGATAWATCPITENAVLRIVGHPRYPNSPGTPAAVGPSLRSLRSLPGHHFWTDDVGLLSADICDPSRLLTHGQITETYLLALARAKGGRLVTFDQRLIVAAVTDGAKVVHRIA